MNFVDTDFIIHCLIFKNLTQKIMETFRKKKVFIKVKMPIKCKKKFKLIGKD